MNQTLYMFRRPTTIFNNSIEPFDEEQKIMSNHIIYYYLDIKLKSNYIFKYNILRNI